MENSTFWIAFANGLNVTEQLIKSSMRQEKYDDWVNEATLYTGVNKKNGKCLDVPFF